MTSSAAEHRTDQPVPAYHIEPGTPALVVVGAGPVGSSFVQRMLARKPTIPIVLYGAEPHAPYNRVQLSSYLAGEISGAELSMHLLPDRDERLEQRLGVQVISISRVEKCVVDSNGVRQRYDKLVLATGSNAYVPDIGNCRLPGVHVLHKLEDADRLVARQVRSRRTVVLGGGLLGLETAQAMQRFNTELFVVEQNHWLMFNQLDQEGAERLREHLMGKGIRILLRDSVHKVVGAERVTGLAMRSGRKLACDTLIICTGIRPNIELAIKSGLAFVRGIKVSSTLATSDPDIHAIGECAEYAGEVSGQLAPGIEQAAVLVDRMTGGKRQYSGSRSATSLKLKDLAVAAIGETGARAVSPRGKRKYVYRSPDGRTYRKIYVDRDRIVGAVNIGDWPEIKQVEQAVHQRRRIWFWHLARFKRSGSLWS